MPDGHAPAIDADDLDTLQGIRRRFGISPYFIRINPARKMVREHKDLVVTGGITIVTGRGATPCWVWSGTVGSKESSDGHRVTRWTL